jgi:hypothetical protein
MEDNISTNGSGVNEWGHVVFNGPEDGNLITKAQKKYKKNINNS